MFDKDSLNKLTDAIPEDVKEKLKESAMEKLGLSNSGTGKSSEETATPSGQMVDQAQTDTTSDVQMNNSDQSESTDEDKSDAA
jgi:hypothetical protein